MARDSALFNGLANISLVAIRSCTIDVTITLLKRRNDDTPDPGVTRVSLKGTKANCGDFVAVVKVEGGWDSRERWHGSFMAVCTCTES